MTFYWRQRVNTKWLSKSGDNHTRRTRFLYKIRFIQSHLILRFLKEAFYIPESQSVSFSHQISPLSVLNILFFFFSCSYFLLIWFLLSHYVELRSINLSQFCTICYAESFWKFSHENTSFNSAFNKRYYPSSPAAELFEADESYNSFQLPKAPPLWETTSVLSFSLWNMKCCHVASSQNS